MKADVIAFVALVALTVGVSASENSDIQVRNSQRITGVFANANAGVVDQRTNRPNSEVAASTWLQSLHCTLKTPTCNCLALRMDASCWLRRHLHSSTEVSAYSGLSCRPVESATMTTGDTTFQRFSCWHYSCTVGRIVVLALSVLNGL